MPVNVNSNCAGSLHNTNTQSQSIIVPEATKPKLYHGAWYYPGWKDNPSHPFGGVWTKAWFWRDSYPERKPLVGWYDESQQEVMDYMIKTAKKGGLDYFTFCWYFDAVNNKSPGDHAITNFWNSQEDGIYGAIGFESQTAEIPVRNLADWTTICNRWKTMMQSPKYFRINGKPVVYIIKLQHFNDVVRVMLALHIKECLIMLGQ